MEHILTFFFQFLYAAVILFQNIGLDHVFLPALLIFTTNLTKKPAK